MIPSGSRGQWWRADALWQPAADFERFAHPCAGARIFHGHTGPPGRYRCTETDTEIEAV